MKTILRIMMAMLLVSVSAAATQATVYSVAAGQLGAAYNPGLIPIGVPALTVTGYVTTGFYNTPTVNYSYTFDSTNPSSGFNPDFHWLGSGGTTPATGAIWTFGSLSSEYYRYTAIDHDPLPNEALESSLWGSNDGGSTWSLGTVVEVYEQGFSATAITDDGSARWKFSSPVNMIADVVGLTQGTYSHNDGDYETDAVMQAQTVPEPGTSALLACGAGLFVLWRWRRSR